MSSRFRHVLRSPSLAVTVVVVAICVGLVILDGIWPRISNNNEALYGRVKVGMTAEEVEKALGKDVNLRADGLVSVFRPTGRVRYIRDGENWRFERERVGVVFDPAGKVQVVEKRFQPGEQRLSECLLRLLALSWIITG